MTTYPKISIVTPTYNAEKDIEDCILSVAGQSYQNKEHLIIDGQSTDRSLEIIAKYAEKYPHIRYISEKDDGIYDAMNKGIDLAEGEWVYFLGADDVFYNDTVLEEIFTDESIDAFDVVYGNVLWGDTGNIYDGKFSLLKLMDRNICHQAIFYKHTIFGSLGRFDTQYVIWADWIFNIKCFSSEEVRNKYIDIIVAKFVFGGHSSKLIEDAKFLADKEHLFSKYFPEEYLTFHKKYCELKQQIADRDLQLSYCHDDIAAMVTLIKERDEIISALLNSLSWKITKPIRIVVNKLKQFVV